MDLNKAGDESDVIRKCERATVCNSPTQLSHPSLCKKPNTEGKKKITVNQRVLKCTLVLQDAVKAQESCFYLNYMLMALTVAPHEECSFIHLFSKLPSVFFNPSQ